MGEDEKIDLSIIKKIKLEWVLLLIFFAMLLSFSSIFDNGYLIHDVPTNLNAADMFIFSAFGDVAKYDNDLKTLPAWMAGGAQDALNFFSPISGILLAQLSDSVNAESYDFLIHLNILMLAGAALIVYFFLRKINPLAAILSLPIFLLIFKWPFNSAIHWGGHIGNINIFLVAITLYCFYFINEKWMFLVLGLINAASFMSHGREFQVINIAFPIFLLIWIIKDKSYVKIIKAPKQVFSFFNKEESLAAVKNYFFSIVIMAVAVFPWWPMINWLLHKHAGSSGLVEWGYNPLFHQVTFSSFGIFLYLIVFGLILSIFYLFGKNDRKIDLLLVFSYLFFISGIFTILGNRLPQARQFYVITFIPVLFLLFVNVLDLLFNVTKINKKVLSGVIFLVLAGILFFAYKPESIGTGSLISPQTMDSIKWMRNNVENESMTLIIYCDQCSQVSIFSPLRKPYQIVNQENYFEKIKNLELSSKLLIHTFPIHNKVERNISTGKVFEPDFASNTVFQNKSICDYDYAYIEIKNENQNVQNYNILLANALIKESNFTVSYKNQLGVVLKNNDVGKSCFQTRKIEAK